MEDFWDLKKNGPVIYMDTRKAYKRIRVHFGIKDLKANLQ